MTSAPCMPWQKQRLRLIEYAKIVHRIKTGSERSAGGLHNECVRNAVEYLAQADTAIMQLGFSLSFLSNVQQYVLCAHFLAPNSIFVFCVLCLSSTNHVNCWKLWRRAHVRRINHEHKPNETRRKHQRNRFFIFVFYWITPAHAPQSTLHGH